MRQGDHGNGRRREGERMTLCIDCNKREAEEMDGVCTDCLSHYENCDLSYCRRCQYPEGYDIYEAALRDNQIEPNEG